MFTWLNKQGVKSDKGFIVQRIERFAVEYRENEKVITVDVESGVMDNNKPCLIIQSKAFDRWDSDQNGVHLSRDEQLRILENFKEALEFQGMGLIVR